MSQEVEDKLKQAREEADYKSMKDKAFMNRFNLFVIGLEEDAGPPSQIYSPIH